MTKDYGTEFDRYYVALATPFDEGGRIDVDAFRSLVRHFAHDERFAAVGGVIVLPEAGEVFTLEVDEKRELITAALEEASGRLPVFAGVASYNTVQTVNQAVDAQALGVDGLFVMPPSGAMDISTAFDKYLNPYPFLDFARAIADAVDLPFIAHGAGPFDEKYGPGYPPSSVLEIVKAVPNFVGWKMLYTTTTAYLEVADALRAYEKETGRHVAVLCAGANFYLDAMRAQSIDGAVSCHWNYSRDENLALIDAWRRNDTEEMDRLWVEGGLFELHDVTTRGDGTSTGTRLHSDFKVNAWLAGVIPNPFVRAPMVQPFRAEIVRLRDLRKKHDFPLIPDTDIDAVLAKLTR
jgi:dihydrodipicolinate synthase/N-acetylneuraminate lyase